MLLSTHPIQLPLFEGPLDLLLQLIERDELDITAISLAQVTDQYLAAIEEMERRNMADLAAFLVVAARLLLIKSRVLLPDYRSTGDDAEDVADDLVQQLEIYRQFKATAQELAEREEMGLRAYVRTSAPPPVPSWFDLQPVTLEGLLEAAQVALDALPALPVEDIIAPITLTVADQIGNIRRQLSDRKRVRFQDVLTAAVSRVEVIITLLAVLELLRRSEVRVDQEGLFGSIFIEKSDPAAELSADPTPLPD